LSRSEGGVSYASEIISAKKQPFFQFDVNRPKDKNDKLMRHFSISSLNMAKGFIEGLQFSGDMDSIMGVSKFFVGAAPKEAIIIAKTENTKKEPTRGDSTHSLDDFSPNISPLTEKEQQQIDSLLSKAENMKEVLTVAEKSILQARVSKNNLNSSILNVYSNLLLASPLPILKQESKFQEQELLMLAMSMMQPETGLELADRSYLTTTFPSCFVGYDAVNWLLANMKLDNREKAAEYGQALMECGMIYHVTFSYPFVDKTGYFYRFQPSVIMHTQYSLNVQRNKDVLAHSNELDSLDKKLLLAARIIQKAQTLGTHSQPSKKKAFESIDDAN